MAAWGLALLIGALVAPFAVQAQNPPFSTPLPGCYVYPSPQTDGWPVANGDDLGSTPAAAVTFSRAALMANDTGASLVVTSVDAVTTNGGHVTGTDPLTYSPPIPFLGTDTFSYEITDATGETAIGIVSVTNGPDTVSPDVSITAPAGTVIGIVTVSASASDNVGVASVWFFDADSQIGVPVVAAPFQTPWNTTLVGDGTHGITALAFDAAGNFAVSVVSVNVDNAHAATVPGVVGMTQAAAQTAITGAHLTVGAMTTSSSTTVASGLIISQLPAAGSSRLAGTAVSFVVSSGSPYAVPTVDKMAFSEGLGKRTTAAFSTAAPGETLVAFAASDGPAVVNGQTLTVAGAGLTWTRVRRAATQFGDAEIWTASAPAVLTNVTVSSTQSSANVHQSLTVLAFTGVGGIGASNVGGAASGAASASLVTSAAGSVVYGVGNDWDRAVARTIPAGQTKVHELVDTPVGDTFWVQSADGTPAVVGSTVTINTTAPTAGRWNMAVVELTPGPMPAAVSAPNVVGLTQSAAQTAITGAGLAVGAISSVSSATVPAGQVMSENPAAGVSVTRGAVVALVVSGGAAVAGPTVDVTAFTDGLGARTTPTFSTTGATVLIALAASDGPVTGANTQTLAVTGGGLTWTRVARAAASRGVSEIWTATAAAALSNVTVTSTQSVTAVLGLGVNQSLTVVAFTGASGVGASSVASGLSGGPSASLATTADASVVYGVGNDFDHAVARTVPASQTKVHEYLASSGDTLWTQKTAANVAIAGTSVTLNDTAPTGDQWNFAIVEVKR